MSKSRMSLFTRLTSSRWERQTRTHYGITYAFPGEFDALQKQQDLMFRSEASECQFQGKAKSEKTKGKRVKSNFIHEANSKMMEMPISETPAPKNIQIFLKMFS